MIELCRCIFTHPHEGEILSVSFDFHGKTVLVTGGSKGIGLSIAESFSEAGARVAICARDAAHFPSLKEQKTLCIKADVTDEADVQRVIEETIDSFGGLDILINNVGGAIQFGDLWSTHSKDWENAFQLNVMSAVRFSKQAIPFLRQSLSPTIINISSISGVEPGYFNPHYTSTKASILNFSKYLANVLAKEKIRVNCVCPGTVETDSWEKSLEAISLQRAQSKEAVREEMSQAERDKIPLATLGTGPDIAKFVLFLASEETQWITGSCFHVNGGKMRAMC